MQTHITGGSHRPVRNRRAWLGREMEGASLQTSHLISKDDAINRTDEHLPSGSEQDPSEDEQVQELPSAQGLLAANKNISFLHRFNREILNIHSLNPSLETKAKATSQAGKHHWLPEKQGRCLTHTHTSPQKPTCINQLSTAHTASTDQRKHLQEEQHLQQHLEHPGVAFAGICWFATSVLTNPGQTKIFRNQEIALKTVLTTPWGESAYRSPWAFRCPPVSF